MLEEMGHPQPLTTVHCNNPNAVGIANNTVKRQRSCSMEMRFFWVADAVDQGKFNIKYYPGKENLADYQSKYNLGAHIWQSVLGTYMKLLLCVCFWPPVTTGLL
jgi:hypothetical protein